MSKTSLVLVVVFFALAALIFVLADGAPRVYAGAFFVILGVATVVNAKRGTQKQQ